MAATTLVPTMLVVEVTKTLTGLPIGVALFTSMSTPSMQVVPSTTPE